MMGGIPQPKEALTSESDTVYFTTSQVAEHTSTRSVWVIVEGKVYDVTEFIYDHPGGEEFILQYAGQDITEIMKDELEHLHSEAAYEILEQYYIGELKETKAEKIVKSSSHVEKAIPGKGKTGKSPSSNFIDTKKPMLSQVYNGKFSKTFYLEQIHIPRYTKESAPIFGHPLLEMFTKTAWWVIPLVWLPVSGSMMAEALSNLSILQIVPLFLLGLLNWTFVEYMVHRFVFHVEDLLPNNRFALTLHFLVHGIHHFLPMDHMRLVMPPVLFASLAFPVWNIYKLFLPALFIHAIGSGTFFGYVCYDMMHYYSHHGGPLGSYLKEMKSYHLDHHYKEENLGFGVTTKLWDRVFGTLL